MKFSTLSMLGLAVATVGLLAYSDAAPASGDRKSHFERPKSTANVGTIGNTAGKPAGKAQAATPWAGKGGIRLPDLVHIQPYPSGVLEGAPSSGHCGPNNGGGAAKSVLIRVRNDGSAEAGVFRVKVVFTVSGKSFETSYGPMAPGPATWWTSFPIPADAWSSGVAPFQLQLDSKDEVEEGGARGERNNFLSGYCVAPAG